MRNLSGSSNHNAELNALAESFNPVNRILSVTEETALVNEAQAIGMCSHNKAADKLVSHFAYKIKNIVLNYGIRSEFLADAYVCGVYAFINAIQDFDLRQGVRLVAFATRRIMGALQNVRNTTELIHVPENQIKLAVKYHKESLMPNFSLEKFAKEQKISMKAAKNIEFMAELGNRYVDSSLIPEESTSDNDYPMREHDLQVMARPLEKAIRRVLADKADSFLLCTNFLKGGKWQTSYETVAELTGKKPSAVQKDCSRAKEVLLRPENHFLWVKMKEFLRLAA